MAWKERSRVDERVVLVSEYLKGERTMTALCSEFGVSRKTAYKWLARLAPENDSGNGTPDSVLAFAMHTVEVHLKPGS